MAASVLFACGLNEQKLPSFVHISEESNVDGSFLISSILGQRLRISNAGTVLVCLQHNYQHYFHAGMRLGYNANIFNGKTLHVVDPLTDIARNGITCKWLRDERRLTLALLEAIRDYISTSVTQRISTTVLIDNLAILLNLGATNEDIILLCHDLAELPKQYENLTVITKMSNCDLYAPLDNNVAKLGTLRIRAAELKSGVSRDVDGRLLIEREVITNGGGGGDVQQKLKQSKTQLTPEKEREEKEKKEEPMQDEEQKKDQGSEKEEMEQDVEKEKSTDEQPVVELKESDAKKQEKTEDEKQEQLSEIKSQQQQQELEPPQKKQQKEEPVMQEPAAEKETQEKYFEPEQELEQMEIQEHVGGYEFEVLRKEVLYKVNDRSIKILSPGEVGVRV